MRRRHPAKRHYIYMEYRVRLLQVDVQLCELEEQQVRRILTANPIHTHLQASYLAGVHLTHTGVHLTYKRAPKVVTHIGIAVHLIIWLCISYMAMHLIRGHASHIWLCTSHMGIHLIWLCISHMRVSHIGVHLCISYMVMHLTYGCTSHI